MRIRFIHSLGEYPWFWKFRTGIARLRFILKREAFELRQKSPEKGRSVTILVTGGFLIGVALLALWKIRSISPIILLNIIAEWKTETGTALNVLATITGIEGVLIGLHFTVITASISNIYTDASGAVINLITKAKSNFAYICLITISLIYDLLLIALLMSGIDVLQLFFLVALVAAALSILVLVLIGLQSFSLTSDPTSLVPEPLNRILNWSSQATPQGWLWRDRDFQNHYRRLTDGEFDAISDIAHFAVKRSQGSREYLSKFARFLAQVAAYYQRNKRKIPPESYWFPRKQVAKDWFITSESETQIAVNTQTSLSLKEEPNHFWLENKVKKLIELLLERAIELHGGDPAIAIADVLNPLFEVLGHSLAASETFDWIKDYRKIICQAINNGKFSTQLQRAAICERITLSASSATIGFFKFISELNLEQLEKQMQEIDWSNNRELYKIDLPTPLLKYIEETEGWLEFERDIEDKEISPHWYRRDRIFYGIAATLYKGFIPQISFAESEHRKLAEEFLKKKDAVCASIVCIDGLQHIRKITLNIEELKDVAKKLLDTSVLKDFPWPIWDWENIEKRLENAKKDLLILLGKCIPDLPPNADDSLPDLLGEATHKVGQASFDALRENDLQTFARIFPLYLYGCVMTSERQKMIHGITEEQFIFRRSVSIMDLLHLSGYAFVYSELHENPKLWEVCKTAWDHITSKEQTVRMIAATIAFHQGQFAILPHDIMRTTWQMELQRDLTALETKREWDHFSEIVEVIHPSLFIRAICGNQRWIGDSVHLFENGLEIFVSMYLREHHLGSQLNYGRRTGDIRDRIRRTINREFDINLHEMRRKIFNLTGIDSHDEDD